MLDQCAPISLSSPGLTGRSSNRQLVGFGAAFVYRLLGDYWMPAFAGMTVEGMGGSRRTV
jgi:hypothetical protein